MQWGHIVKRIFREQKGREIDYPRATGSRAAVVFSDANNIIAAAAGHTPTPAG